MPQVIEVPVNVQKVTTTPFRSDLIAVNNAQRMKLTVQASAPLAAGQWVLKTTITPDTSIPGAVVATANASATERVMGSALVEGPLKLVYVEQITPASGGTVEKISVFVE
jgi:hypothetical protein